MTKEQLIQNIAASTNVDKAIVRTVVYAAIEETKSAIQKGDSLFIRGFGTMSPKMRKQKVARNISRGETIMIAAHKVPAFKAAKEFKKSLNR